MRPQQRLYAQPKKVPSNEFLDLTESGNASTQRNKFDGYFQRHAKKPSHCQTTLTQRSFLRQQSLQSSCSDEINRSSVRDFDQRNSYKNKHSICQDDSYQFTMRENSTVRTLQQRASPQEECVQSVNPSEYKIQEFANEHFAQFAQPIVPCIEQSRSPSPAKNVILQQLRLSQHFTCPIHKNEKNKNRHLRYVCSDKYCDTHILCNACLMESFCPHDLRLEVEDFMTQPVLGFIDTRQSETTAMISEVIKQQTTLYNKVKMQADSNKLKLKQYLDGICQSVLAQSEQIQTHFAMRIDQQLQKIRQQLDEIQVICNTYKDHFENITFQAIEESLDDPETLTFKLRQSLQEYFMNSDDPQEQLSILINQIQTNLLTIPEINTENLENVQLINPQRFRYTILIKDPLEVEKVDVSPTRCQQSKKENKTQKQTPQNNNLNRSIDRIPLMGITNKSIANIKVDKPLFDIN